MSRILGHAAIYGISNILRNITSFIMLPIYTRYLLPEDYGVVELLSMLIDFIAIIMGMRLGEAVFRYYGLEENPAEKKKIVSSAVCITLSYNIIGVLLLMLFSGVFSGLLFGSDAYKTHIALFSVSLLFEAFIVISLTFIRAQQYPWRFLGFNMIKLAVQVSLNVYFIVYLNMRVEGVIYSAVISGAVITLLLGVYVFVQVGLALDWAIIKRMVFFSFPMMIASVGAFYLTFGDRYFLRIFTDLAEVGVYALGYKFGFLLMAVCWSPFQSAWDYQKYDLYKEEDAISRFQQVFVFISGLLIIVSLGISLFVHDLLIIMSDPSFHDAYRIVPVVLVAYIFQAWTAYANFGLLIKEKTHYFASGTAIAVIVITVAYLSLIPFYGGMGAAVATVIGFLVRLAWINFHASRQYDMALPWFRGGMMLLLATAAYLTSLLIPGGDLLLSLTSKSLLMLLFIAALVFLILKQQERNRLYSLIAKGTERLRENVIALRPRG